MGETFDLIIDLRDGGDWSLDLCYAGLTANDVNLIDIPHKRKHREWWDVIEGRAETSWGLERRTLGFSRIEDDSRGIVSAEAQAETLETLVKWNCLGRVWLDERMESFQKYREFGLDKTPAKVVVVAGHDRFWNQSPSFVASLYGDKLEAMLLDNWYPEYANLPFRTRRIGWSCNFDHYWERPAIPPEKDIDISFVGYNSHPDRARFIDHIEKKWKHLNNHIVLEKRPDSFDGFVSKAKMFEIMQRSKICLNLRGAADRGKTLRAYEIPYVGSFMLSQDIDDPGMRDDFGHGLHCRYFANVDELDREIEEALKNETWREFIADYGHEHATHRLSARSRWAEVLKWLEQEKK